MRNQQTALEKGKIEGAVTRLAALLVLWVWAFWSEMPNLGMKIPNSSNEAHSLVIPAAILLLVFLRRSALAASLTKGSAWGILFLIGGMAMYAAATWPFSYGYVRDIATIPILAGVVMVTCGWRILKLSFPMLLLVFLSIAIPSRLYAALIIRPETYTIAATATVLDKLPAVNIIAKGID
ncbi:MAG: archaeosortase/exosortase family protein, partial [Planctomycetota bacterium]